jgi:hypothetical protein
MASQQDLGSRTNEERMPGTKQMYEPIRLAIVVASHSRARCAFQGAIDGTDRASQSSRQRKVNNKMSTSCFQWCKKDSINLTISPRKRISVPRKTIRPGPTICMKKLFL